MIQQSHWLCAVVVLIAPGISLAEQKIHKLNLDLFEYGQRPPKEVTVRRVYPRGIADRMGIRERDVILWINDKEIDSIKAYEKVMGPGDSSVTVIWRSGNKYYECMASWVIPGNPNKSPILRIIEKREVKKSDLDKKTR
jgi:hypothetical protein